MRTLRMARLGCAGKGKGREVWGKRRAEGKEETDSVRSARMRDGRNARGKQRRGEMEKQEK